MDKLEDKFIKNPLYMINNWLKHYDDDNMLDGLLATIIQLIILNISQAIYEHADEEKKNGKLKYSSHDAMSCAITQLRYLADRLEARLIQEKNPSKRH